MELDEPAAGTEGKDDVAQKSADSVKPATEVGTTGPSNKEKMEEEETSEKVGSVGGESDVKREVLGGSIETAMDKKADGDENTSDKTA